MGLKVTAVELSDFRNYQHFSLEGLGDLVLLIGPNAVGKTNLIEALQLCTACASFRNPQLSHLVRMGESSARVSVSVGDGSRNLEVELTIRDGKKDYWLNGKKRQARTLRGNLPAILFCPDDLSLVKGSAGTKRTQLDALGSQLSANYHAVRRDYEKIIQQKNRYLREAVSHGYLESINEVVAQVGAQFYLLRSRLVEGLAPYVSEYYRLIAGSDEEVSLSYAPSWVPKEEAQSLRVYPSMGREEVKERLWETVEAMSAREHERRCSLVGPHADRPQFFISGNDASLFASQGQQRSIVLAYKLAEVSLVRDKLNQNPVLLLDDVMSELDARRRSAFMSAIPDGVQAFISSTNLDYFDEGTLARAQVVELGGGE